MLLSSRFIRWTGFCSQVFVWIFPWVAMVTIISALDKPELGTIGIFLFTEEEIRQVGKQFGLSAIDRLEKWQQIMVSGKNLKESKKIKLVNNFFNKIPYISDLENYRVNEYWATPIELLVRNGGDCEDYAMAKYFTLIEIGVPEEKLQITYAVLTRVVPYSFPVQKVKENHVVLTYYPMPDSEPLVLDNMDIDIFPAGQRDDLSPVYSFNSAKLWFAKEGTWQWGVVGNAILSRPWQEFLKRLEGKKSKVGH